jgi:hypothetical protein
VRREYAEFLARKAPRAQAAGFEPKGLPGHLFDFQGHCVEFCIRQGSRARSPCSTDARSTSSLLRRRSLKTDDAPSRSVLSCAW